MASTLRLIFKNAEDRNVAINVQVPNPAITVGDCETVMDWVVAQNCFNTSGGDIISKVRAEIVSRTVDMLQEF